MNNGRLFEILYLLMEGETVTASALARRLEVSPRTIYRDRSAERSGHPNLHDQGKGEGESGFYRILCWRNPCFPIRNRMKSYMPCKAWRLPAACRTKRCFPE